MMTTLRLLLFFTTITTLFLSPFAPASAQEWRDNGEGKIVYPSGRSEPLDFAFAFEKSFDTHIFRAGAAKMRTDEAPPNYILNVIINDEGLIYIGEFANGFFKSFELTLGENHYVAIKPRREFNEERPLKHLVVYINDMSYLIDTTHPSLKFSFNEQGISDIDGNGLIRDLSSRRN